MKAFVQAVTVMFSASRSLLASSKAVLRANNCSASVGVGSAVAAWALVMMPASINSCSTSVFDP